MAELVAHLHKELKIEDKQFVYKNDLGMVI